MSEPKAEAKPILETKEKLTELIPTPAKATPVSSAQALKGRLDWGEPALTILDARSREEYLQERIMGAMLMSDVSGLAESREIYVYANSDGEAAAKADELRQAGFESVSQLQGGIDGWKAVAGTTEGRAV